MLAYWKLLMRDRLMALAPSGRRREGQAAWKAVLGWAGMTLLAVSLFAMAVLFEMVMYDQAKAMGEPQAVIALAFLACTLMTLIYSFFYVISLLFFGRDCAFVGALPIPSHGVLLAKLATVLAGEIGLTALVCLPLLIRYGVETGAAADYYVRSLLGTLFIPGIPVAITTLLSFALIRISALWKRREGVTTVMTFVLVAAIVGVEMSINMNMDEGELAQAAAGLLLGSGSLTELVLGAFPPLQWLTTAATGSGLHAWGQAALYAGVSIAALALVVALCGGGYMRLALRQAEVIQRVNSGSRRRSAGWRVHTPFWALYRQEMREVLTVPTYATNCLTGVVMFPVLLVVMAVGIGRETDGMALSEVVAQFVPKSIYLAVAAGFLALTCTMGLAVSTAVSREGARHDMRRIYPVAGSVQLGAKLLMGMTFNLAAALVSAVALWVLLPGMWLETLGALAVSQLFSLLWCLMSLLLDVYHPKLKWKTETEAVKQSMNAMISMFGGMILIAVLVGAAVLLTLWGWPVSAALGADVVLLALLDAALWMVLSSRASITYCLREYSK